MRVVASDVAVDLIAGRGGRLYVWPERARCCGGLARLHSATDAPPGRPFREAETDAPFALFLPEQLARLPEELHLAVRRFPRRVEAYWNGCAWIA